MQKASELHETDTLIVSISGQPKSAKTFTALTAPPPIFYHQLDLGSFKRVAPHLEPERLSHIYVESYPRLSADFAALATSADIQALAKPIWAKFVKSFKDGVIEAATAPTPGTTVIDTDTILWELMQQALVEDSKKAGAMKYGRANAEHAALIDFARNPEHPCNLILISHMKEIWKQDEKGSWVPSGKFEPDRQKHTAGQVDVSCITYKPTKEGTTDFRMKITDCGVNPLAEGLFVDSFGPVTWDNFRLALGV